MKIRGMNMLLMAGLLTLGGTMTVTADTHKGKSKTGDIVETAVSSGSFNTLVEAVKAAGLVETLKGEGPFTVFAPTDEAFAKLPPGTVDGLLKDKAKLTKILAYHVVPGKLMASDVTRLKSAKALSGGALRIDSSSGVKVNDSSVIKADVEASNGVIHVIDTVLIPSSEAAE